MNKLTLVLSTIGSCIALISVAKNCFVACIRFIVAYHEEKQECLHAIAGLREDAQRYERRLERLEERLDRR